MRKSKYRDEILRLVGIDLRENLKKSQRNLTPVAICPSEVVAEAYKRVTIAPTVGEICQDCAEKDREIERITNIADGLVDECLSCDIRKQRDEARTLSRECIKLMFGSLELAGGFNKAYPWLADEHETEAEDVERRR